MDNKSDSFKKLQAEWYEKLKKKGFEDTEQEDGRLKRWASHDFNLNYDEIITPAREDYYRLAGQFLHEYKFQNQKDRMIWELHSQGFTIKQIVEILKKKGKKAYKRIVHEKIQELARKMKCLIRGI